MDKLTQAKNTEPLVHSDDFYLVGIGASAGGLEALEHLVSNVDKHVNAAFVIVQHLSPNYKSMMVELLSRKCILPVEEALDGGAIEKGKIYLNSPGMVLKVKGGRFISVPREKEKNFYYPIDEFFISLGKEKKEHAIGIILSGSGSDGSKGLKLIKEKGGLVIVQRPREAQFDSMPKNAITSGMVDFILPAKKIPNQIGRYIYSKSNDQNREHQTDFQEPVDEIIEIMNRLKNLSGINFHLYNYETIWRRVQRRVNFTGAESLGDYLDIVDQEKGEIESLLNDFYLSSSQFFRDRDEWEYLEQEIIPEFFQQRDGASLRVWIPGCATGEEAYSFAILCYEYLQKEGLQARVKIFATDVNSEAIKKASSGQFYENISTDIPGRRLQEYFRPNTHGYKVTNEIRDMIVFTRHDLLEDPPFSRLDFVLCRNLLMFFQANIQKKILAIFNYALNHKGFLMLGKNEAALNYKHIFEQITDGRNFFRSIFDFSSRSSFGKASSRTQSNKNNSTLSSHTRTSDGTYNRHLLEIGNTMLLEELASACIIVDHEMNLLKYFGQADKYLKVPNLPDSWNLLKMVPPDIAAALNVAITSSVEEGKNVVYKELDYEMRDKVTKIDIIIKRYGGKKGGEILYMILLKDSQKSYNSESLSDRRIDYEKEKIELLQQDLRITRETLHAAIEQLQTSNEELMVSNEELQGANEELQSVNEELHTINTENQYNIEELSALNSDMSHLLQVTSLGVLFLDQNTTIRRFNLKMAEEIFIKDSDIGRPVTHFSHNFSGFNLEKTIAEVLKSHKEFSEEVVSLSGNWYQLQVLPFYEEEEFMGILITLVDISNLKDSGRLKKLNNAYKSTIRQLNSEREEKKDLKNQMAFYQSVTDQVIREDKLLYAIVDHAGKCLEFSSGIEELQPGKGEDNWGEILSFLPVEMVPKVLDMIDRCLVERTRGTFEFGLENEGSIYLAHLIPLDEKKLIFLVKDRREKARLEQDLKNTEISRQILASSLNGSSVYFFDDKQICYFSEGQGEADNYIGKHILNIFPVKVGENLNYLVQKTLEGNAKRFEFDYVGESFSARLIPMDLGLPEGNHGMVILTKITDQKKLNLELVARVTEMEQFAYSVSHDLKTPIRAIKSFAQIIKNDSNEFNVETLKHLDFIIDYSQHMAELVKGLVSFARLGKLEEELTQVSLEELLESLKNQMGLYLREKNVTFTFENMPVITGIPSQLSQLFQNMVENAIKFNQSEEKQIRIAARETEDFWEISVRDNGIGIDPKFGDQIFEIFKRLHSSQKYPGNGIGLATCRRIVNNHGGKIWFESTYGKGTTFYFKFPIRK